MLKALFVRRVCRQSENLRGDGDDARFRILALRYREAADVADVTVWCELSNGAERLLEGG